jgi:hypothetical protein
MGRELWTGDFLAAQRQVGDPEGDAVIREVFARNDLRILDAFMGQLVGNDTVPDGLPSEITGFLEATSALPHWADPRKLEAGAALFDIHGPAALAALVCASLPECYTMQRGVRILDLTSQLGEHTNRRLHQTAAMVLAVMRPGGFSPKGNAIRQTQKVRLIHAAIRLRILSALGAAGTSSAPGAQVPVLLEDASLSVNDVMRRHGFEWNLAADGIPINQEDLAFTLLTFGHVIPRAMRSMGVPVSEDQYEAFLHCWNVSGAILGVNEALMAHTRADAEELFARIKARQGDMSEPGKRLTDSLLTVIEQRILRLPLLRPMAPILMRMMVGDATAKMLGLDTRHARLVAAAHRGIAVGLGAVERLLQRFTHPLRPLAPVAAWLGFRVVQYLCLATDDGRPRQVAIPSHWG